MISISNWGTFDLENYGDLLFPLLLEQELAGRLDCQLQLFSPCGGRISLAGNCVVKRIVRYEEDFFYEHAESFQTVILGGGDLIRFDDVSLFPFYDLSEADKRTRWYQVFLYDLGKLAKVMPVLWNAVGVPFDFLPDQYSAVRKSVEHVQYLSVRDEISKKRLEIAGVEKEIFVVADSAFVLAKHYSLNRLGQSSSRLQNRNEFPRSGKSMVLEVSAAFYPYLDILAEALNTVLQENEDLQLVLLPIGICHGDEETLARLVEKLLKRPYFVQPNSVEEIAAAIANANYFAGSSFHGMITAAEYGVNCLNLQYEQGVLSKMNAYVKPLQFEICVPESTEGVLSKLRRLITAITPENRAAVRAFEISLEKHFDRMAHYLSIS